MADTIAYVVGGSISHAEIREVEPSPSPEVPETKPEPRPFRLVPESDFSTIKPESDLTKVTPVELSQSSTSFWSTA